MSKRNISIGAVILVIAAVVLVPRLLGGLPQTATATAAPTEIVTAFTGRIAQRVQADGSVVAGDQVRLPVRVSGIVADVYVELGDEVEAGDPLLRLETAALERAVANAEATLTIQQQNIEKLPNGADLEAAATAVSDAQAALDDLRSDLDLIDGDISVSDLTDAEQANLDAAEQTLTDAQDALETLHSDPGYIIAQAQLTQAQIALAGAQANLADATLRAPFDGRVANVAVAVGEQANGAVITLIKQTQMVVDLAVDEIDLGAVRVGQAVELTFDAYPNAIVRGSVVRIAPTASGGTPADGVTYATRIALDSATLDDDMTLRAGMTVNADIVTAEQGNVTLVPNRAITYDRATNRYTVQKVDAAGATQAVDVTIGVRDGEFTVITSGVRDGERMAIGTTAIQTTQFGPAGGGPSPFGQ